MKRKYALLLLILAPLLLMGIGPFLASGPSISTTSTPAAGSGVTSFFTTDLAPVRPFQNNGRFYTTWTTTNSPATAGSVSGTLAYANILSSPSQGLLAYLDRPAGVAHLDVITAYNATTGATTRTSLISTAFTFVSGAQLVLVVDMNQDGDGKPYATLFYNNAIVGTRQDLSAYSSWIKQNRRHALFSTTVVTPGSVVYNYGPVVLQADMWKPGNGAFESGTTNFWTAQGNNTVTNDSGQLKIAYVDNATGANGVLAAAYNLVSDLTIGALYQIILQARVNAGSSVIIKFGGGALAGTLKTATETDLTTTVCYFVATHASGSYVIMDLMGAGEIIWLDNLVLRRVQ